MTKFLIQKFIKNPDDINNLKVLPELRDFKQCCRYNMQCFFIYTKVYYGNVIRLDLRRFRRL